MTLKTVYPNREEWLAGRGSGIGASEISSAMGRGYKTPLQLWRIKIGTEQSEDISGLERVKFGNDAEEPLRALYSVMHPEHELDFTPYTVFRQEGDYKFLFDTPDGWLTERGTGRRGLYESKTATLLSKADYEKWNEKVPDNYFLQICQGMFCGDFDFAVIFALLRNKDGDAIVRAYNFERTDCEWQIEEIKREGKRFWQHVLDGTMPPAPLPSFS